MEIPAQHSLANRLPDKINVKITIGENLAMRGIGSCPLLESSENIAEIFKDIAEFKREVMIAGALDCKCRLVHWSLVSVGTADHTIIRIGDVFVGAIETGATSIFLVHNHPSGSLVPSGPDFQLTHEVAKAGLLLGYRLIDHVIVTRAGFKSLLTCSALKSRQNRFPVTPAVPRNQNGCALSWKCINCGRNNVWDWFGIAGETTLCIPAKCSICGRFTWLTSR